MRYSNIQESFFDFLKFVSEDEEKRIIQRVDEFMNNNPDFTYDMEFNLPGLCPIERIAQSLVINEGKLRKVLKNLAKRTDTIGVATITSKVWSGDVLITLNAGSNFKTNTSSYKRGGMRESLDDSTSGAYLNESFLSSLKKTFGFASPIDKEELDGASLEVVKFLYDRPIYDYHKKSDTPGLIFVSLLAEEKYTNIPFKTLEELFKGSILDNCDVIKFKYKDIEGPLVVFGKPSISRKEYLTENTADFTEMLLIKEIQRKLISRGFLSDYSDYRGNRSAISGELDRSTITAILNFQQKYKIATTRRGDINIETLRRLGVSLSFLGIDLKIDDTPLIDKLKKEAESMDTSIIPTIDRNKMITSLDAPIYTEEGLTDDSDDLDYDDESEEDEIPNSTSVNKSKEIKINIPTDAGADNNEIISKLLSEYDTMSYYLDLIQRMNIDTEITRMLMPAIGPKSTLSVSVKKDIFSMVLKFIFKVEGGDFFKNVGGFEKFQNDLSNLTKSDWIELRNKVISYINSPSRISLDKAKGEQILKSMKLEFERVLSDYGISPKSSVSSYRSFSQEKGLGDSGASVSPTSLDVADDEEDVADAQNYNSNENEVARQQVVSKLMDNSGFNFFNSFMDSLNNKAKESEKMSKGIQSQTKNGLVKIFGKGFEGFEVNSTNKSNAISELLDFVLKIDGPYFTQKEISPLIKKFKNLSDMDIFNQVDYKNLGQIMIDFIIYTQNSESIQSINNKTVELYDKYSDKKYSPNISEVFYIPVPSDDGIFSNSSRRNEYVPSASIYKFEVTGPDSADFEIEERASSDATLFAYPEKTIDPACERRNSMEGKTKVKTINKGKAKLVNGDWKVIQKALVKFE